MDSRGPEKFVPDGDSSSVSVRWKSWIDEFEFFADTKGFFNESGGGSNADKEAKKNRRKQRRALLLFHVGPQVRDIFKQLENTGDSDDYQGAVDALNGHFVVQTNVVYQRHVFRKAYQNKDETVAQYCTRLRVLSQGCEYRDLNDELRDQIVTGCLDEKLRCKFLLEGSGLTLDKLCKMAANHETVLLQAKSMAPESTAEINRLYESKGQTQSSIQKGQFTGVCRRCARKGHKANDKTCPAWGETCNNCKKKDHFAAACRSGRTDRNSRQVRLVNDDNQSDKSDSESEVRYAYMVRRRNNAPLCELSVGGVRTRLIIDSGSDCNSVSTGTWEYLKSKGIKCVSKKESRNIKSYCTNEPLKVKGVFWADVTLCSDPDSKVSNAEFVVMEDKHAESLLSREVAEALGLIVFNIRQVSDNVAKQHTMSIEGSQTTTQQATKDNVSRAAPSCSLEYEWLGSQFAEVFTGLGCLNDSEVHLNIDSTVKPVVQKPRHVPYGLRAKVEQKLKELQDLDVIEKVNNPSKWVSAVVIAPKGSDVRICVDMRMANKAIVKEKHPMPTIEDVLSRLNGKKVFSKVDLKHGFHQLKLDESSREITTFAVLDGLWQYKRLNFGVTTAPEIYQSVMQRLVGDIPGVEAYLDDIIVSGDNKTLHDKSLMLLFERLKMKGLTVNESKCEFGVSHLEFLGHEIDSTGVCPSKKKVQAAQNFRLPKEVGEVRSFLGLIMYMNRFLPNVAEVSAPLRKLIQKQGKGVDFHMGPDAIEAFEKLKQLAVEHVKLAYFDPQCPTQLVCDAGPVGLGAVLLQTQGGRQVVIAFGNRSLSDVEIRYSQNEKEALALVWGCEHFRDYLVGTKFTLITDHQSLVTIYGDKAQKPTSSRVERWALRLQPFWFEVKHVQGKSNIADPLSRLVCTKAPRSGIVKCQDDVYLQVRTVVEQNQLRALTAREIERVSDKDVEINELHQCVSSGNWESFSGHKVYKAIKGELCTLGRLVLRGNRIVLPEPLRLRAIELAHEGHLGIVGTKTALRSRVYWPGMDLVIERYVRSCVECQITDSSKSLVEIKPTELPNGPWQAVAVDFHGPLPSGEHILAVVDYYSRYVEVRYLRSITVEKTTRALDDIFFTHGFPYSIRADNGGQFREKFREYCDLRGINVFNVTPRWPQANGEIERQNRSLGKRIEIAYAKSGQNYRREIMKYLQAYHNLEHPGTGKAPNELIFGRKIRVMLPDAVLHRKIDQHVHDKDGEYKGSYRREVDHSFRPGDTVLVENDIRNKSDSRYNNVPVRVTNVSGSNITLKRPDGRIFDRNASKLRQMLPPVNASVSDNGETEGNQPTLPSTLAPVTMSIQPLHDTQPGSVESTRMHTADSSRPLRERAPPIRFGESYTH